MTIKFYVDDEGHYIGGFDGVSPPLTYNEVRIPPADARQMFDRQNNRWLPISPTLGDYQGAIQSCLDAKAQERGYDDGHTIANYVSSSVPLWAAEAQAFVIWRDAVWVYSFGELEKVLTGKRELLPPEEFCGELPAFIWP